MSANEALRKIPVVSAEAKQAIPQQGLYWKNRLVRYCAVGPGTHAGHLSH